VPFPELDRVVLWVSHIVVQHKDSQPGMTVLRAPSFKPDPPPPERSRADAFALARKIAERTQHDPASFERLAKEYSEDIVTRDSGGSLGGVKATQLPGVFVDALARLRPGSVSGVVESDFGYHILKRRPVPDQQMVAGQRIIIGYDQVLRLPSQQSVPRSRAEAFALAGKIVEEARANKSDFETLVRKYSDGFDAAQDGDLGVWSVRDPGDSGPEVEALSNLSVGAVSEPMDSKFGVQVLKRNPAEERRQYAMTAIRLRFNHTAPASARSSKEAAEKLARSLLIKLEKNPKVFTDLQREHCCIDEVERWSKGRGPIGMSQVLDELEFGEVARTAVPNEVFLVIPKRLDPGKLPPLPQPLYEVPTPSGPDFEAIIRYTSGETLAKSVRMLRTEASKALNLNEPERGHFIALLDRLAASFVAHRDPARRLEADRLTRQELKALLGPKRFGEYEEFLNKWATALILGAPR
jgi:parvulin-like peptidyl-prolyl isomerase